MITQSKLFRSVADVVVPGVQSLDDAAWQKMGVVIEQTVAQRPAGVRRQLMLFLRVLNVLSMVRYRRPLAHLPTAKRANFLEQIENFPVLLVRRGFWGLRTLVYMGYYTQPEARAAIGYRADARGWQARR